MKALHIGCGGVLIPGFINTDVTHLYMPHNIIDQVKLLNVGNIFAIDGDVIESNSIDYIYSEHFIEHLSYKEFKNFLKETYRILKPGGIIRTACPYLEFYIDLYQHPEKFPNYIEYVKMHCSMFNKDLLRDFGEIENVPLSIIFNDHMHMWGHKMIYDKEALLKLFEKYNFKNIKECNYKESEHSIFKNIEHDNKGGYSFNKLETLILECEK